MSHEYTQKIKTDEASSYTSERYSSQDLNQLITWIKNYVQ